MTRKFVLTRKVRGPNGMEKKYLTDTEGLVWFTKDITEARHFDTHAEAMRHPYKLYGIGPGTMLEVQEVRT